VFEPVEFIFCMLLIVRHGSCAGACSVRPAAWLLQSPDAISLFADHPWADCSHQYNAQQEANVGPGANVIKVAW